jgi:hypothetical protein
MSQDRGRIDAVGFKAEPKMLEVLARQSSPTMEFKVPEKERFQGISGGEKYSMPTRNDFSGGGRFLRTRACFVKSKHNRARHQLQGHQ